MTHFTHSRALGPRFHASDYHFTKLDSFRTPLWSTASIDIYSYLYPQHSQLNLHIYHSPWCTRTTFFPSLGSHCFHSFSLSLWSTFLARPEKVNFSPFFFLLGRNPNQRRMQTEIYHIDITGYSHYTGSISMLTGNICMALRAPYFITSNYTSVGVPEVTK